MAGSIASSHPLLGLTQETEAVTIKWSEATLESPSQDLTGRSDCPSYGLEREYGRFAPWAFCWERFLSGSGRVLKAVVKCRLTLPGLGQNPQRLGVRRIIEIPGNHEIVTLIRIHLLGQDTPGFLGLGNSFVVATRTAPLGLVVAGIDR